MTADSFSRYRHTQQAPLFVLLYAVGGLYWLLAWWLQDRPVLAWLFPAIGLLMLVLGTSFQHLTVEDIGDRLTIQFGPLPLFQTSVCYDDVLAVAVGRTSPLDGWGIHWQPGRGWLWNLWGRECVVFQLRQGVFRVGSDDAQNLARFVESRLEQIRIR